MLDREIISVLPDAAAGSEYISTPEVHRRLKAAGIEVPVIKTIQRRLDHLLDQGLVESEKRGVALCWRRKAGASGMAAKAGSMMTRDEALALQTLKRFASRQIPALVAQSLDAMFQAAQSRLQVAHSEDERRYLAWPGKVAVQGNGFALQYPEIDPGLFAAVSQALFYEHKLQIGYSPRIKPDNTESRIVLPLGLVEVAGLVYLVAGMEKYPVPAMYRLDRLWQARMLPEPFAYPGNFVLQDYVQQQRQFDFMVEGTIALKLRFSNRAGDHLLETPLSSNQKTKQVGEHLEVQGTVLLSQRLRWWLRAFGPHVEVLAPKRLREEMAGEARALAALYHRI